VFRLFNWRLLGGLMIVAAIMVVALWPETIEVDAVSAVRRDLVVTIDEEGETRVRERFVVAAPVAGRLQRVELQPGDRVIRGRRVARFTSATPSLLDPRVRAELSAGVDAQQAALGQARAELERTGAELTRAQSVLRRRQELAQAGIISKDQIEEDEAAVRTAEEERRAAEFAVTRAEHELEMARARLEQPAAGGRTVDVFAPVDGVVLKLYRESEGDMRAGDPLLEVGDPADLEVVADLLSTDAVRVSAGDNVFIEQWGGSKPLAGRVRRVEPAGFMKVSALGVEEQRVNVIIDFDRSGAPTQLGDGYRVEVRVVVSEVKDAITVPLGALFRRGEGWAVFIIEGEQARLRSVQTGERNDLEAQIVSGLAEGEMVVLHPPDTLADGMRIAIRTAVAAPAPTD
jgi:HlyD family secretion protein